MQAGIIGIAERRDGGEPVERAAQDHDDQPRIAPVGARARISASRPRPRKRRRRAAARARVGESSGFRSNPCRFHLSSPLEFRRHQQQRQRLLPRFRRSIGLPRFRRCRIASGKFQEIARIDVGAEPRGHLRRRCRAAASCPRARPMPRWCRESHLARPGYHSGWPSRLRPPR